MAGRTWIVERKDTGGWFSVGSYGTQAAANAHARMVRDALKRRGQTWRGRVRVSYGGKSP